MPAHLAAPGTASIIIVIGQAAIPTQILLHVHRLQWIVFGTARIIIVMKTAAGIIILKRNARPRMSAAVNGMLSQITAIKKAAGAIQAA
jgi:hypothetical protein